MSESMLVLLEQSIRQIDNLYDYYMSQRDSVVRYVKKKIEKYRYGIILDKYFGYQIKPDKANPLSHEEEQIIEEMLECFEIIEGDNKQVRINYKLKDQLSLDKKYILDPNIAREEFMSLVQHPVILSESVLMMLLVKYEDSIASIYRYLIEKYPQGFLSDKSITYSELMTMKSDLEEIKERFIAKEIDRIMREPISNWYDDFKKKQRARFLFADNLFEDFKEIYYRRNLIVHNQGIVNETYLSNIKDTTVKIGDKLLVDGNYLEDAFSLTSLILVDTFFGLRKLAGDKDDLVSWIESYGYNCLCEKRWKKAKCIFQILLQDENMKSIDRIIAKVNYWIAVKNIDGVEAIEKEVEAFDVSAMQLQFWAAKEALLNKHEEVAKLLDECMKKNEIPSYYIKTWPLLNEFRISEEYRTFFEEHKEQLEIGEYEAPTASAALLLEDAEEGKDVLLK